MHTVSSLPDRIIEELKHPALIAVVLTWAKKLGQDAERLRQGQISREEFEVRARRQLAEITGTTVGATVGSMAGGLVPGVGRLFGAFAGGLLGQMVGHQFGVLAAPSPVSDERPRSGAPAERSKRNM